jgi:MGT family glycosyltransferase
MTRVLMMSTGEKGHTNPMMGVALWLRRLGHDVAWLCIPEPVPQLARAGIEAVPLEGLPPPPVHITGGAALARLVRDPPALRSWIKTLLLDAVPDQIEPVRRAIRGWRPDVLACDPMLYQGVIAAHLEKVPYAGISSSLNPVLVDEPANDCDLMRTVRELAEPRRRLFERYGMAPEFRVCDCLSPILTTVFATRTYVGDVALPDHVELVGPSRPPPDAARGDEVEASADLATELPVTYASFGSQISQQPEIFTKIAAAVATLGTTLFLSVGDLTLALADLPGDVRPLRYAPQRQLLARATRFVTHGGANSVMEALSAGVPFLLSPVCNDQPMQARFVRASGVGVVLDLYTASVDEVRAALQELPSRAPAVAAVKKDYAQHDGARTTAELLCAAR